LPDGVTYSDDPPVNSPNIAPVIATHTPAPAPAPAVPSPPAAASSSSD
jgi:hypothetical protein